MSKSITQALTLFCSFFFFFPCYDILTRVFLVVKGLNKAQVKFRS